MPYYMYVSLQDDDKILVFTMDSGSGQLTPKGDRGGSGVHYLQTVAVRLQGS